jgi:hypothetical protein
VTTMYTHVARTAQTFLKWQLLTVCQVEKIENIEKYRKYRKVIISYPETSKKIHSLSSSGVSFFTRNHLGKIQADVFFSWLQQIHFFVVEQLSSFSEQKKTFTAFQHIPNLFFVFADGSSST